MKFGIISLFGGFAPVASRLALEVGDKNINVLLPYKEHSKTWDGILPKVEDVNALIKWNPDVIIFDMSGEGELADYFIENNIPVIGASSICDLCEFDRWFGIKMLKTLGFDIPETVFIKSYKDSVTFLDSRSDKKERWVIKFNDNQGNFSSYVSTDIEDLKEELEHLEEASRVDFGKGAIIQEYVKGIELSCEGWFDGEKFVPDGFNYTMEEKKFLTGGLGPSTGCEGNLVWKASPTDKIPKLYKRLTPLLHYYKYVGPWDINWRISEKNRKPYAIEITPRFGYDAFVTFLEGLQMKLSDMFSQLVAKKLEKIPLFHLPSLGVRVSVPPYPYNEVTTGTDPKMKKLATYASRYLQKQSEGIIVRLKDVSLLPHVWFQDVRLDKKSRLIINGAESVVAVCTSKRDSLQGTIAATYSVVQAVDVPDIQYRKDIGQRAFDEIPTLSSWGLIQEVQWIRKRKEEVSKDSNTNGESSSQNTHPKIDKSLELPDSRNSVVQKILQESSQPELASKISDKG
jgi:phosphoribosylamine--glycine ligase